MLPFSPVTFMYLVGIIEIVVGILVLTRFTRIAAYIVAAWLVAIALNLFSSGHYLDVAVRDLVMAVGSFTLAKMTAVRESAAEVRPSKPKTQGLEPRPGGLSDRPAGRAAA